VSFAKKLERGSDDEFNSRFNGSASAAIVAAALEAAWLGRSNGASAGMKGEVSPVCEFPKQEPQNARNVSHRPSRLPQRFKIWWNVQIKK